MRKDLLRFIIIFFSFCPYLPRLVSGIDNQPTVFILIILESIIFKTTIFKKNDLLFLSLFLLVFFLSALKILFAIGSNLSNQYIDYISIINTFIILIYFFYFKNNIESFIFIFTKYSKILMAYFIIGAITFVITNGYFEHLLFNHRNYSITDTARGIYPLSPEPTGYAKLLMTFGALILLIIKKDAIKYVIIICVLLLANSSVTAFLGVLSYSIYVYFNTSKYYITFFILVLIFFSISNTEFLSYITEKRYFVLLNNLKSIDFSNLVLDDMQLLDRSTFTRIISFQTSIYIFINNPVLGKFYTYDSIGGLVSFLGYLGLFPFIIFLRIIIQIIKFPFKIMLPILILFILLIFSDSYTQPSFYLMFALLFSSHLYKNDILYNPT